MTKQVNDNITQLFIDGFCGAGGTTHGIHEAVDSNGNSVAKVVACINHDPKAIMSHSANYPDCYHAIEDIRTAHLEPIKKLMDKELQENPYAKKCGWFSLECVHFSKAKGGGARNEDSRTLANSLFRYEEVFDFDFIYIENVEEFMSWGKLDENGKPISKDKGTDYIKWVKKMCSYGFNYEYRILNCADYGAPTTRVRYFGIFAKKGYEIRFPQPTHSKVAKVGTLFSSNLKPWRPVKECLNFEDEGNCIFDRKIPLSEKTLERIYAGLVKYVAGGKDSFIANYYSGKPEHKVSSIEQPIGTITTIPHASVVKAHFMPKFLSNNAKTGINAGCDVNRPCPTVTCQGRLGLATAKFLMQNNFGANGRNPSLNAPARTLTASGGQLYIISAQQFLAKYYSGDGHVASIDNPAPTVRTKDALSKIHCTFLAKYYKSGQNVASIDEPSPTVTTKDRLSMITVSGKKSWLLNPQYKSNGRSVDDPCFTLIARMDKMPPYLVTAETGELAIEIKDDDSPATKQIKEFMSIYGIYEIKMRMLNVQELKLITGFPKDYILCGTQADMKKFIGNAVPPAIAKALVESLHGVIKTSYLTKKRVA